MPIDITMPRLSDTMESGTIIKWSVAEGDAVSAGDVVADVETDKATMEMQVYDDGTIAKITVPEGKTVDVGTVIAVLAAEDEDASAVGADAGSRSGAATADDSADDDEASDNEAPDDAAPEGDAPTPAPTTDADDEPKRRSGADGRLRVSPVARQIAEDHDIDLRSIQGSGPSGRIIKRDVLRAAEASSETVAARPPGAMTTGAAATSRTVPTTSVAMTRPAGGTALDQRDIPLSNMRQVIARRLVESKTTIPHYQVTVSFDMDPLLDLRRMLNEQLVAQGVKLSVNDFLVKACALAMYEHPEFNASWGEDHIAVHGDVNIGVAVSLPAERGGGLVVATIRHADQKSLRMISAETKQLAEKARTRGLTIEEMSDATFTLSNLGMFGVEHFTAIINPPNSAILAVGAALQKPVVRDDALVIGHEMSATLSLDHRVIDGAMAAQYLQTLKGLIENPGAVLV